MICNRKKLEEENLVYRVRNEKDKRYYKVFITEKALNIKEEVFNKLHAWDETIKQSLTKEEEAQMTYLLKKITTSLLKGENH